MAHGRRATNPIRKRGWSQDDHNEAKRQNWGIARTLGGYRIIGLRKVTDAEAFEHVGHLADKGSDLHERALALVVRSQMENTK